MAHNEIKNKIESKVKENNLKIEYVNYGTASRLGDLIIMNKNLLDYEDYCMEVLDHELRHSGKFTKKDFIMDFFEGDLFKFVKFITRHPSGLLQMVPVCFHNKTVYIDVNMILNYFIILCLGVGITLTTLL